METQEFEEIEESNRSSVLYGLIILSIAICFSTILAVYNFRPAQPPDDNVTITLHAKDYPSGFVAFESYKELLDKYSKAEAKLPIKDREAPVFPKGTFTLKGDILDRSIGR